MRRLWRRRSSRERSEAGFTFVEVLIGLVLLSVVGVALARGVSGALGATGRISASLTQSARLARLDDSLRSLCARIRTPYWEPGQSVTATDYGIRIGWLDGEAGGEIALGFRDGVLTLGDGRTVERYLGFHGASFTPIEEGDSRVRALRVDLELADSRRIAIVARMGSVLLAGAPR
jgi:hypothetical protein